jgi:hypothetical protein
VRLSAVSCQARPAACQRGHRIRFTTIAALVGELIETRDEKKLLRFQKQIASYQLDYIYSTRDTSVTNHERGNRSSSAA